MAPIHLSLAHCARSAVPGLTPVFHVYRVAIQHMQLDGAIHGSRNHVAVTAQGQEIDPENVGLVRGVDCHVGLGSGGLGWEAP